MAWSFGDFLREHVIESAPVPQPTTDTSAESAKKTADPVVSIAMNTMSTPALSMPISADGSLTAGFTEKLKSKLAVSPSFSVVQIFMDNLTALTEVIPEEGNRFRAALKVSEKHGVSIQALMDAYQAMFEILDGEASKFSGRMGSQKDAEIGSREAQIAEINTAIEAKNAEIKALMENRDAIAIAVVEQNAKLNTAIVSFEGAQSAVRGEITDAMNKLKIYFGAK